MLIELATDEQEPLATEPPCENGDQDQTPKTITVNGRRWTHRILFVLIGIEVLLVALDLVSRQLPEISSSLRKLVNLAREGSIGTWFATTQTFVIGAVLWVLWARNQHEKAPARTVWAWALLACFFTYASLDDGSKFHERVGSAVRRMAERTEHDKRDFEAKEDSVEKLAWPSDNQTDKPSPLAKVFKKFPSYPWQVVFAPVFGSMGLLLLYVVFGLMKNRFAQGLVIAGLALLVLAVGIDFLEGVPNYSNFKFANFLAANNPDTRHRCKVLEEFIEMVGMTMILAGFSQHLFTHFPTWKLEFKQ